MDFDLSVLDVSPVSSGSNSTQALRNTLDLARLVDRLGYRRYNWAVTRAKGKVRFIVGHVIVCTLKNRPEHGPLWIALDKELLGTSSDRPILELSDDWE